MNIAEIYETELIDIDKVCKVLLQIIIVTKVKHCSCPVIFPLLPLQAIAHYEQAGDYYKGEESIR